MILIYLMIVCSVLVLIASIVTYEDHQSWQYPMWVFNCLMWVLITMGLENDLELYKQEFGVINKQEVVQFNK